MALREQAAALYLENGVWDSVSFGSRDLKSYAIVYSI